MRKDLVASQSITAQVVKKLREETGCAMMDCKYALWEANGDFELAKRSLMKPPTPPAPPDEPEPALVD